MDTLSASTWEGIAMALAGEEKDYATAWRDKIEGWLQEEGWQVGLDSKPLRFDH